MTVEDAGTLGCLETSRFDTPLSRRHIPERYSHPTTAETLRDGSVSFCDFQHGEGKVNPVTGREDAEGELVVYLWPLFNPGAR